MGLPKNTAAGVIPLGSFISTTTGDEVTTGTPTGTYDLDGSGGALSGSIAFNEATGQWELSGLTEDETNGDILGIKCVLTGCFPIQLTIILDEVLVSQVIIALDSLQTHGDETWKTAAGFATSDALNALAQHGDSAWATATGFATPNDLATLAKEATLTEIKGDGWADETLVSLQSAIAAINAGTTTLIVTPVAVTVSAGQVIGGAITQYQHASFGPHLLTIVDSAGQAVDLSTVDLTFCVYEEDDPDTVLWSLTKSSGITVGGTSNNEVTLSADEANTATAGIFRYVLWDMTNRQVRARGTLTVESEAYQAP